MSETRVKSEKASLLSLAIISLSTGITLIAQDNILTGGVLVVIGLGLLYIREHFKFHRWHELIGINSLWRGKGQGEK